MSSPSGDLCYALLKYHNGFPLYGILKKSVFRCINENVIRYRGCSYDASVLLIGSKQRCELWLSIIENQPSVFIEKSNKFNGKRRFEETTKIKEILTSDSKNNEVKSSTVQSISTAALMHITGEGSSDAAHNQQDTGVLTDITNHSDVNEHNQIKDPDEAMLQIDVVNNISVSSDKSLMQSEDEDFEFALLNYSTSDEEYDAYIELYENKQETQHSQTSEELWDSSVSDRYVSHDQPHTRNPQYLEMSCSQDNGFSTSELVESTGSDLNFNETHTSNNAIPPSPRSQNLADNLGENIDPDICSNGDEHQVTTLDNLKISCIQDNGFSTSELVEPTDSDDDLNETHTSNNAIPPSPRSQNIADNLREDIDSDICSNEDEHQVNTAENLRMSSQDNYILCCELDESVDSDIDLNETQIANDALPRLYTESSLEMSSTSNKLYVARTLMNLPTPAEIRKEAINHASFEGKPCSRCSLTEKKILSPEDKSKYWRLKYHFCIYCKKRVTRFARHLINVHKNEPEVVRINALPAKSSTRLDLLQNIRNRGMLMYNLDDRYNSGDTIVVRRPAKENNEKSFMSYIPCSNCGGNFRRRYIARHYKKCTNSTEAKKLTLASLLLGKPILKEYFENVSTLMTKGKIDTLAQICVQDTAILLFGSKLVNDLSSEIHRDNDIRSKLRQMAQLLIEIKKLDTSVKNLMDAFVPSKIKVVELAVKRVCGYDAVLREYKKPSLAVHMTTLIRKCVDSSITFMIESGLPERKIQMESFLHLVRGNLVGVARSGVNKLQQNKMINGKKVPLASDIYKLNNYLKSQAAESYKILQNGFNEEAWNTLSDCSLLLLMIFNRKRTGESQRIFVTNYNSKRPINEDSDIYKTLDENQQQICKQFARMEILGKWRRTVVMLFPPLFITYIDTVLKYREEAGVSNDNIYLFGTKLGPRSHRFANAALSTAAIKCGAVNPASLRGTNLRKHIATITQMVNMTDSDIKLLSSFMGHDQFIHETSYRQTDSTLQIAKLTKLLMAFNEGSLDKIKGKTLDEIEMDPDLLEGTTADKENLSRTAAKKPVKKVNSESYSDTGSDIDSDISDPGFRRRKPKKTTVKRRRWTEMEIKELDKYFSEYYTSHQSPSLSIIDAILSKCTYLKQRTREQINAQISNKKRLMK